MSYGGSSYPFWLKNQANNASANAWQARRDTDKVTIEKERHQKASNQLVDEIESLLIDFENKDDIKDLIPKLKESIEKFKEEST